MFFEFSKKCWLCALFRQFSAFFDFSKILKIFNFFQNSPEEINDSLGECHRLSLPFRLLTEGLLIASLSVSTGLCTIRCVADRVSARLGLCLTR
jgi:hypothetical protein